MTKSEINLEHFIKTIIDNFKDVCKCSTAVDHALFYNATEDECKLLQEKYEICWNNVEDKNSNVHEILFGMNLVLSKQIKDYTKILDDFIGRNKVNEIFVNL